MAGPRAERSNAVGRPDGRSETGLAAPVCSIAATLDVIGDRWSLLILRDVFRGARRFSEIQGDLGIAKNLLSDRLSKLVDHEILERVPYHDRPVRYEYRLTAKGADLSTALIALMGWGDRWYATGGAPIVLVHETCGHPLEQAVRCPHCDQNVPPGAIRSRPGPGRTPS
ncbi:MAG: helix-turn-helix domain-containing protein [Actinomycetota bacterium]